eukprot:jgi/Orpsp1_1/1190498/evm.model.d7180000079401.1
MRHSSTEDNLSNKNTHGRKLSQASQLAKETKFSVSENNIMYDSKESIDSINKNNKNEDNESIINNSLNEFEDKEIFADQITVYIQKLVFCKNDRNKRDIAFIISIRNSDSGDELWRIQKSYNDIQNLENIMKSNYSKEKIQNIGKLPERNLNSLKIESKQIQLKITMEIYLQHLCNIFRNSIEIADFLSKDIISTNNKENEEEKDGEPSGIINLKHAKVVAVNSTGREKFHHAFRIIEYKDEKGVIAKSAEDKIYAKHLLCSENDKDRDEWVDKIKSVISKLNDEDENVISPSISNNLLLSKSNNNSFEVCDSFDNSINNYNIKDHIPQNKEEILKSDDDINNDNDNDNGNDNDNDNSNDNDNNNDNDNFEDANDNNESPQNNNGWDSSDEEDVNEIIDYDEKNYLPEGFNFEDFEKQGLDINEYIKMTNSRKNSEDSNNNDNDNDNNDNESDNDNGNDNDSDNDNGNDNNNDDDDDDKNNNKDNNKDNNKKDSNKKDNDNDTKIKDNINKKENENEKLKKDVVIDDNERVMKQMIPPPLVPKSKASSNPKLRVAKEEKQRRLHFSWYKFKKSNNSNDFDNKDQLINKNKKVFGVPLEVAVKNSKIKDDYELPAIVYRSIEYLDAKGAYEEEGIYRLSGSKATIQSLKNRFDRYGDVNLLQDKEIYDVHVITGLLKLYLRELPTTIMTKEFQPRFIEIASIPDREEKVKALANLISYLPLANYTLLRCLAAHLVRIVQNSDLNKMTLSNIAIVFGPTLGIPIGLFVLILSEFEAVFCWTTLKESEEEENIMSILFSGPEDYLNIHSISKAQQEARNKLSKNSKSNTHLYKEPIADNNEQKVIKSENQSVSSSCSDIPPINSDNLITGSIKIRGKSNTNIHKDNDKISNDDVQVIKEEPISVKSLALDTEIENLINEKCKNMNNESDEHLETILNTKEISEARRKRQERSSSLFISTESQIDYVKSLRRLSYGESPSSVKAIFNRNSQDYMTAVPDNFRLSEMLAKEIKIKDNEEILGAKNIKYTSGFAQ